jgi:hypothetical protein
MTGLTGPRAARVTHPVDRGALMTRFFSSRDPMRADENRCEYRGVMIISSFETPFMP